MASNRPNPAPTPIRNIALAGIGGTATISGYFIDADNKQIYWNQPLTPGGGGNTTSIVTFSIPATGVSLKRIMETTNSGYTVPMAATGFKGTVTVFPLSVGDGGNPADGSGNGIFSGMLPDGTASYNSYAVGSSIFFGNALLLPDIAGAGGGGGGSGAAKRGKPTPTNVTLPNATPTTVVTANAIQDFILIQNTTLTGILITTDGSTPSSMASPGMLLAPGGSATFYSTDFMPNAGMVGFQASGASVTGLQVSVA